MSASRLPSFVQLGAVGVALLLTQAGCPGGAELENAEQWSEILGTGGTATAGTGGSGPVGGTGGSGGTAPVMLDPSMVDCGTVNPTAMLNMSCAKSGCHKGGFASASLNLVWDAGFAARLKDVPAKHEEIDCDPSAGYMECVPPPTACGSGKLLVNSKDSASSWMLTKLHGMQTGCGEPMPPTETPESPENVACIEAIVRAIAAL